MMYQGLFGVFPFYVAEADVCTFRDFKQSRELQFAEHKTLDGLGRLQHTGRSLDPVSLTVLVVPLNGVYTKKNERHSKIENGLQEIASEKPESTIPNLRNDLEQFGGTNDVTIMLGNKKKGLVHIERRHGKDCIGPVLEAVANGKITKFVAGNKTVWIEKDGYRAVLSLDQEGKQKTWLLTGFDIVEDEKKPTGDNGKVSARHVSMHVGPILSRSDMGAVDSFKARINATLKHVKF